MSDEPEGIGGAASSMVLRQTGRKIDKLEKALDSMIHSAGDSIEFVLQRARKGVPLAVLLAENDNDEQEG
jgi:hypothetical protein